VLSPHREVPSAINPFSPPSLVPMASRPSRPLPVPPGPVPVNPLGGPYHTNIYSPANPYHNPLSHPSYTAVPVNDEPPAATLRGGTLLHKGFYDLLALIPTPSPSRFLWGATADPSPDVVAGPRYEDLPDPNHVSPIKLPPTSVCLPSSGPVSPKKARRIISKDMVSKPMGFVYVCDHCTSPALSLNLKPAI
jgi:protein-serine/threonine kinase